MPSLGLPIYGQASAQGLSTPRWRSAAEREGGPPPAAGEFPEGAAEPPSELGRRSFAKLMGAAAGLAGLAACKPPRQKVVSFVRPPPEETPSVATAYATAAARGGYGVGVLVTSREGRPTKVEGNPGHPASLGGSDALLQAELLELYDPARVRGFARGGRHLGRLALLQELSALASAHEKDGGARLRFLVEPTSSPAHLDLRQRILKRFPRARFVAFSPLSEAQARAGAEIAFGRPLDASWSLTDADVVLSLDADLLGRDGEILRQAREHAARRTDPTALSRLYVAEAGYSITGGVADHRFRMRSAEVLPFARAVAGELARRHGLAALAPLSAPAEGWAKPAGAVADDLWRARGRSLVAVGPRQPAALHALAAALNEALGNAGRTVAYRPTALLDADDGPGPLAELARELAGGAVDALVVTAWNPLHTAPADLELRQAFARARDRIVLSLRDGETYAAATWRIARSHPLEAWGDLRSRDGTATVVQPLIAPLLETLSEVELLAAFVDDADRGDHALVQDGWRSRQGAAGFDLAWQGWLAAGLVPGSATAAEHPAPDLAKVAAALQAVPAPPAGLEVSFAADYRVLDGRYLENAWLQEFPDPITKLTWDNAAQLSPATARRLHLEDRDEVRIKLGGREVIAGVLVVPGQADEAVAVTLGYGQRVAGEVGKGSGFDAGAIRTSHAPWFASGAEVERTGRRPSMAWWCWVTASR